MALEQKWGNFFGSEASDPHTNQLGATQVRSQKTKPKAQMWSPADKQKRYTPHSCNSGHQGSPRTPVPGRGAALMHRAFPPTGSRLILLGSRASRFCGKPRLSVRPKEGAAPALSPLPPSSAPPPGDAAAAAAPSQRRPQQRARWSRRGREDAPHRDQQHGERLLPHLQPAGENDIQRQGLQVYGYK